MDKPETSENNDIKDNINNDTTKKSKKGYIISGIFLAVMTGAVLYILLSANDIDDIAAALSSVKFRDFLPAIICILAYIIISPISMCILCKAKKAKISNTQSYLIGACEHFFNNITPYQTGAQPFQVYAFTKGGVKAAEGTGLVICNYISFLIALNTLVLSTLVFAGDFFAGFSQRNMAWVPALGIFMNLLTLVVFLCIVTCKWMRDFFKKVLRLLCKIPLIGNRFSNSIPAFETYCDNAQLGAKEILNNPKAFIKAVIIRFISLLFYYSIPFFLLRSLNIELSYDYFIYTLLATCFAINAIVFIPTPGTSGGIEMSFTIVFTLFSGFTGAVAAIAAIIWRALTYYLVTLVSFLSYLLLRLIQKKKPASP